MTTKEAIEHLTSEFEKDPDYRRTWVANIAVKFQDTFHQMHRQHGLYEISNEAAERFMEALMGKPRPQQRKEG